MTFPKSSAPVCSCIVFATAKLAFQILLYNNKSIGVSSVRKKERKNSFVGSVRLLLQYMFKNHHGHLCRQLCNANENDIKLNFYFSIMIPNIFRLLHLQFDGYGYAFHKSFTLLDMNLIYRK